MNEEYKPIANLWKDSEGYRYFGTLKLSSKIKYDGDDFIPLWEWVKQLQQENKQLKENYERIYNENCKLREEHNITDINLLDENYKLKDNWNKLKEIIKKKFVAQGGFTSYEWNDLLNELLDKMQELQGSDSSVKD